MARRKLDNSDEPTGNEWLATFSDTMTLLLTFFILLYSFSTVDANKFRQISAALQSVLTGRESSSILDLNLNNGNVPVVDDVKDKPPAPEDNGDKDSLMYKTVKEFIEKNNLESIVSIKEDSRGIIIQLRDNILFESGIADIKDDSKSVLEKISSLIGSFNNEIIIEGHTDNRPMSSSKFPSNWELSSARAISVLKYFVDIKKLEPTRFSAHGYGEYRPVAANDSAEHMAMNRRVNILIVTKEKEEAQ